MKLNIAASLLFSLAVLSLGNVFATTTATTDPVGFSNVTLPGNGGASIVVPTLNNTNVYAGMAAINAAGTTITPAQAPGWTAGAYNKTALGGGAPNYPTHYAEVVAGAQEGLVIDIDSNTTTALTVQASEIPASIRGTTVQIVIRQHVTLDKVIQGATGLTAFSDGFTVYNSDGSYSDRFYDGSSFVDESFANPAGHTVIYPGNGIIVSIGNPVGATLTLMGSVKTTKTQINLYAGVTNIVGPPNPASSTKFYGQSSLATALGAYTNGANNFGTDGNLLIVGTYYSDGTNILDGSFTPLPPSAPDAIPLNRGVIIGVDVDTTWTVPGVAVGP